MDKRISQKLRDDIYAYSMQLVEKTKYETEFMNLLSSLWDVYNMPKREDIRFSNLGDEIEKHFVINDDWSQEKLFNSILKLKEDEQRLIHFFSGLLNISSDSNLLESIKESLNSNELRIEVKNNKWEVYIGDIIKPMVEDKTKPFYVCRSNITNAVDFKERDIDLPIVNSCFVLTFNYGWNDYGIFTRYRLYYKDENGKLNGIGIVKLMCKDKDNTSLVLPNQFYSLSSDFCSLGEDINYYKRMKDLFGKDAFIYLSELCDAALYSKVHDKFADDNIFKVSLCRYNSSDKALREGRYYVYGRSMADAFSFKFLFKPKFFEDETKPIEISFPFCYECPPYKRMIGLIGENGVGKTSLLNDIIKALINGDNDSFVGLKPIFAKVLVNSYSPFDHYPPKQKDYTIGYEYCGLIKGVNELFTLREQIDFFVNDLEVISIRGKVDKILTLWKELAKDVIPDIILDNLFDKYDKLKNESLRQLKDFCFFMSSGETIFLFSISNILAKIRPNSLLLFDEPEQHLHPQAITRLINAILKILEKYDSYAIVATHSALVIREILSQNVFVFNRNDHELMINKIGIESFGEDISVLNNYVFKNVNEDKRYEHYVRMIAEEQQYDYNNIVKVLQNDHNELSLSLKMLIMNIINRKNNQ